MLCGRLQSGKVVQEERLVWFHPCACVYASNPHDEPEFSEDPELEPPSLRLLRLWCKKKPKQKKSRQCLCRRSRYQPIIQRGTHSHHDMMSSTADPQTFCSPLSLSPARICCRCGLSKSGLRLPESCQTLLLAARGSQQKKQPN